MDNYTYEAVKNHIISAYNLLCPTGVEQVKFAAIVREVDMDKDTTPRLKLKWLLCYLQDGVDMNNW